MSEIRQRFSVNVEYHLMPEGGAVAAEEGAVSTQDKVPVPGCETRTIPNP